MEQPRRRLSAVWFADIVGYTPLSARDEPAALALVSTLQRLAREITETEHEGRIVKFIGDAVLAEFSSTESAVRAAVAVQERFCQEALAQGRDTTLRIGVHLGEVTATPDGDLYGDGINTAARLQHEAQPGQVIASEDVWRQLRQRPEFRFDSLGDVELKGITARVGVYDVLFGAKAALSTPAAPVAHVLHQAPTRPVAAPPPPAVPTPAPARSGGLAIAVGIVLAALIGVGGYAMLRDNGPETAPVVADPDAAEPAPAAAASADSSAPSAVVEAPPAAAPTSAAAAPAAAPTTGSTAAAATPAPTAPDPATVTPGAPAAGLDPAGRPARAGQPPMFQAGLAGFEGLPPLPGTPIAPQAMQQVQRSAVRYLQVLNAPNPARALRQIYPTATPLQIQAVEQMRQTFGPGLQVRPGPLQATRGNGDTINARFMLLLSSPTRRETPSAFEARLIPGAQGLDFIDIRRLMGVADAETLDL